MDNQDLGELLLQARPRSTSDVDRLAAAIASDTRHQIAPRRRRWTSRRFGAMVGACAAGVVLTAAGTVTAYQLQIPPFQGLEPGLVRISPGVPADYVAIDGKPWTCEAFLEFRDITPSQADKVATHIRSQDWSDLGPSAYRQAEQTANPQTVNGVTTRFYDIISDRLRAEAAQGLPGSVSPNPAANANTYSGSSIHCQPGTR